MLCVAFVKNPYRWFILSKPVIFYFILYLFIFSCAGSSLPHRGFPLVVACGGCLRCDAQALHCGGFSCRRARALGARGLSHCGCQTPEHRLGSHGMRPGGSTACGIFLDQGLNPCLLPWQADSLLLSHQGRSPVWGFINRRITTPSSQGQPPFIQTHLVRPAWGLCTSSASAQLGEAQGGEP